MTSPNIFIEHVLWATEAGFTPDQISASVGIQFNNPNIHDAVMALEWAWKKLESHAHD